MKTYDLILEILRDNPSLTNEQVAETVQRQIPGAATSAASVSSVKSKAKKVGDLPQTNNVTSMTASTTYEPLIPDETPEERNVRIRKRYSTLERMAHRVAAAELPALIVSGPPGLGKSYTVEKVLEERELLDASTLTDDELEEHSGQPMYDVISGTITAVGLYIALWNLRNGGILVLDDCDDVFRDETCLNLLKAVLDSNAKRRVSYRKKAHWMNEMGIPTSFEFAGSIVFCTNVDFEIAIAKGSSMAPHFSALIDRSLYLSLTMRTTEDFLCRLRHVAIEDGMLEAKGLTKGQADEVMIFVENNVSRFYSLSLRLMHQMAICMKADPINWEDDVEATKMRTL